MVLTSDIRKQKLGELLQKPSEGKQKLYYRGETHYFDIYRIDLDWLIYNRHNGRLEVEMLTWEQEHSLTPDHYDDELHMLIENFLWESNIHRNIQTRDDIENKQQQRCGIVSLDGVIIDGNRRAMLLRKLEKKNKTKQYFDAIILPDAYDENQKEIVRLETQYQLGEDDKVEYGPLQKYLKARRLHRELGIPLEEVDKLMGQSKKGFAKRLLDIMDLMDDYLEHIGCPNLYTMLKDRDGTKEGMFVDLYGDLNRLTNGKAKIPWAYDPEIDPLQLKYIQFDYMRLNKFADAKKSYREISHHSKGKNFFAHQDIWEEFRGKHEKEVDSATMEMGALEDFIAKNPDYTTRVDAARARDHLWGEKVESSLKENFGKASYILENRVTQLLPREYLERAKIALEKVRIDNPEFVADTIHLELAMDINRISYAMKRKFDRNGD